MTKIDPRVRQSPAEAKPAPADSNLSLYLLISAGLLLFLAIQARRAWVSDDAFITFRVIDNLINGYGLVWNIGERVQAFTHPLWLLALSTARLVSGDLVYSSMLLSIVISLAALLLFVTRLAASRLSALFALAAFLLSNAAIDYTTSGLENPLSHLLIVLFFINFYTQEASPRNIFWLSFIAALGILNRQDLALIFAPALLYALFGLRQLKAWLALLAGMTPLVLWEIFSMFYYGFPVPNTAYAKLNTGLPFSDLALQGLLYIRESILADPLTLTIIGSGMILAFFAKDRRSLAVALGIALYLIYIVRIGGDFMSGRFLAAPFLCSLVILARFDLSRLPRPQVALLFSVLIILGLLSPTPTLNFREPDLTPRQRSAMVNDNKISNERRFYGWSTGLFRLDPVTRLPEHPYAQEGIQAKNSRRKIARRITVGMFGYYAGPEVYVVDELALGDALLARLPAQRKDRWRIGHFQRTLPAGYLESLESKENHLADASLARYYDQLKLVTQGNLLAAERWNAIWKLNSRQFDHLIDVDTYRYPKLVPVLVNQVAELKKPGSSWDEQGNTLFKESGLEVNFGEVVYPANIELSLDGNNAYEIAYYKNGKVIERDSIDKASTQPGLHISCVQTPRQAVRGGIDKIRIFATGGDADYSLGHLRLVNCGMEAK